MKKNDPSRLPDKASIKEIDTWMKYAENRREFVRGGALAVAMSMGLFSYSDKEKTNPLSNAPASPDPTDADSKKKPGNSVPLVTLGGTGVQVSILGLGTQTMGENQDKVGDWENAAIDLYGYAIDRGVNYLDSARGYGRSEQYLGEILKTRKREDLFITTKVWENSYNGAKASFEKSLSTLGTDYIDLLHIHGAAERNIDDVIKAPSDTGYNPGSQGAWRYLEEQKRTGKARFLGITGHGGFSNMRTLIKHTHDPSNSREKVDVIMPRMSYLSHSWDNFHDKVAPLIKPNNIGCMIMKVFNGPGKLGQSLNDEELKQAVRYVRGYDWAHGCVIGGSSRSHIDKNIDWVSSTPMNRREMEDLRALVAATNHIWEKRFARYVADNYSNYGERIRNLV